MATEPTIGSLFSGIGGLDLAVERATGGRVVWFAETDPFCRLVLAKHWPGVPCYEDVREVNEDAEIPQILCGGFPCQDVSNAGRREGINGARSGLWLEFARCIRLLRPRVVFVENVPGLLVRGFGRVLGDLAACGYDAEWSCLRAADVGAPHLRRRVFVLAIRGNLSDAELDQLWEFGQRGREQRGEQGAPKSRDDGPEGNVADADGGRREVVREPEPRRESSSRGRVVDGRGGGRQLDHAPHEGWETEPPVGRVAPGVPGRVDRLRVLGNAVVRQQAEVAFCELARRACGD